MSEWSERASSRNKTSWRDFNILNRAPAVGLLVSATRLLADNPGGVRVARHVVCRVRPPVRVQNEGETGRRGDEQERVRRRSQVTSRLSNLSGNLRTGTDGAGIAAMFADIQPPVRHGWGVAPVGLFLHPTGDSRLTVIRYKRTFCRER